ncbi:MAG: hypothetical protein U9Q07_04635 [Planctomycetota bacterium]|nr:hypothetical protein [Planctomycetota bacterium]
MSVRCRRQKPTTSPLREGLLKDVRLLRRTVYPFDRLRARPELAKALSKVEGEAERGRL